MSLVVRDFEPAHLKDFSGGALEVSVRRHLEENDLSALKGTGPGWTGFWNGEPIGAAGFVEVYGPGSIRATAWAILLSMPQTAFLAVHRRVKRGLADAPYRRIEAHVHYNFSASHRWVQSLGFTLEQGFKPLWMPDGAAVSEYVILKE